MFAPWENKQPDELAIIGAGLTGLLLAEQAAATCAANITLYDDGSPRPDHIWGYWDSNESFLQAPRALSRGTWSNWRITTIKGDAVLRGDATCYCAVSSRDYEAHLSASSKSRVTRIKRRFSFETDMGTTDAKDVGPQIYDTAHYTSPANSLLQHFGGVEVRADQPCFDASTAVLMDFRVTQEHGIHFIYLLPFSATEALVESTVFSPSLRPQAWYQEQISAYLSAQYEGVQFAHGAQESGVIPMARLSHEGPGIGVGLAGNALRASSGYAFHQIHRQIHNLFNGLEYKSNPKIKAGTSRLEGWMDRVFLRVLRRNPSRAPEIFLAMAKRLSGDDFARFMNGHAPKSLLVKVILAVPKWPFIRNII